MFTKLLRDLEGVRMMKGDKVSVEEEEVSEAVRP